MTRHSLTGLFLGVLAMWMLSSCSSQNLYTWYGYDDAFYDNMKKQSKKSSEKLSETYLLLIDDQKGTRRTVPPGIYAEYAYSLFKEGKTEDAIEMFRKEAETYPESAKFIERIIQNIEK